jgi:hypothetical protein
VQNAHANFIIIFIFIWSSIMKKLLAILVVLVVAVSFSFGRGATVSANATITATVNDVELTCGLVTQGDAIDLGSFYQDETKYWNAAGNHTPTGSPQFTDPNALFVVHGGNGWKIDGSMSFANASDITIQKITVTYGTTTGLGSTWGTGVAPASLGPLSAIPLNSTTGNLYVNLRIDQAKADLDASYGNQSMTATLSVSYN